MRPSSKAAAATAIALRINTASPGQQHGTIARNGASTAMEYAMFATDDLHEINLYSLISCF